MQSKYGCSKKEAGLSKGLAVASNSLVFAIWAFMSYYGSRMVMYHGAHGGTVFAVGAANAVGGLSLGHAISNMKYFFSEATEATAAGEQIMEVINRIPKIDIDNIQGEILENVSGEVEFKHVEFAYPSRPETIIFKDLNLKIPAGKAVALVGGSGSGKSTVLSLLTSAQPFLAMPMKMELLSLMAAELHLKHFTVLIVLL